MEVLWKYTGESVSWHSKIRGLREWIQPQKMFLELIL